MYMHPPIFIDVFMQPLRDNPTAQVAISAMLLLTLLDVAEKQGAKHMGDDKEA